MKVPAKYKRLGIRVRCNACGYQVSATCKQSGRGIDSCKNKNRHKYMLLVVVPGGKGKRRIRILDTRDFDEVLVELKRFREELKANGYHKVVRAELPKPRTLIHFFTKFLDTLEGKNVPEHLIKRVSEAYVADTRRSFEMFLIALCKNGYMKEVLVPDEIGDNEVGIFHSYLLKDLGFAARTYNKHMTTLRKFYTWLVKSERLPVRNPFESVVLQKIEAQENLIISKEEYEALLDVITRENGIFYRANRVVKNAYRPWLKDAIRLALETGVRREELFLIKWSDLQEVDPGKYVFRLSNLKVNRIMGTSSSLKFVPLTKSLRQLLNELGMEEKQGSDDYIIERDKDADMDNLKDALSRGFSHYIKLVSDRPLTFKCLRKCYITHLSMSVGDTGLWTGHSNTKVLRDHYLSSAYIAGNLGEFTIF